MPRFRLVMRGLACRLGTVLNILCLLRYEVFLHFVWVPLCFFVCSSEGWKEALPPFEIVMARVGRMFYCLSMCGAWEERAGLRLVGPFL